MTAPDHFGEDFRSFVAEIPRQAGGVHHLLGPGDAEVWLHLLRHLQRQLPKLNAVNSSLGVVYLGGQRALQTSATG